MSNASPPADRDAAGAEISAPLLDAVADWIMEAAMADAALDALFEGACLRLLAAGVPLARVHLSYRTLHPAVESVSLVWTPDEPVREMEHMHGASNTSAWRRSPFYYMVQRGLPALRRRLTGPSALFDFGILDDLHDAGMTDYLALFVRFDDLSQHEHRNGVVTSWATARDGGFTDADIKALLRIKQRLGVAAKLAIKSQIAENVVSTYLGPRAGMEVLNGHIQRGDGRSIHAVVWYSDLRGSSALADRMAASQYIALLNGYFECAAGAVIEAGGEVLTFIGDGVLAIFPISQPGDRAAAESALAAAEEAQRRIAGVNETLVAAGRDPIGFGIAIHVGHVVFGNIGAGARLSFTTIGSAVNEVARLEELTKTMDANILMSGEFKAMLPESAVARLTGHGFRKFRGIAAPIDVYSLDD